MNNNLAKLDKDERITLNAIAVNTEYNVPKWALQAFAWTIIIVGGASATAAQFGYLSIVGAPAGAVLTALGIWGGITGAALLWWVDNNYPDEGRTVYVCF